MNSRKLEQTVSWIIKIGLAALTLLPLYISSGMLFPFITGKNFVFRILVEILAVLWVGLMVVWPQYRPRLTPLVKLSTIFILIVFLADLFSPNPYRAFFSNYERMEGFMMIFHLWLYFLMLSSVLKSRRDWFIFTHIALLGGIAVGLVGLVQYVGLRYSPQGGYRIDSTIGNPTYLAAYLSFHVWLLAYLLRRFWERWWLRILYSAGLVFELVVIYLAASRGAAIGLFLATFFLLIACVFYWPRIFPGLVSYRKFAIAFLLLLVIAPFVFWQIKDSSFIPPNSMLSRLASISLKEPTTLSRFAIWNMSLKGFADRPILGWGQENYYLVFQKYYDPKLYASEPWFDRSHNILLDWLVHTGILGAGAFFSMLGAAFYLLWKNIKSRKIDTLEGAILGVALVSYLAQNLFVFDNLNTYLMFFALLAYINIATAEGGLEKQAGIFKSFNAKAGMKFFSIAGVFLFLVALVGFNLHYKPMTASKALINALLIQGANKPGTEVSDAYKKALSYKTFGDTEIREQVGGFARAIYARDYMSVDDKKRFVEFAREELQKEIFHPAKDIKHMIFLAAVLAHGPSPTAEQLAEAEAVMKEAIRISPTKQILYFQLAEVYLGQNRSDDAIQTLKKAVDLEPTWDQANINLVLVAQSGGRQDIAEEARGNLRYSLHRLDDDNLKKLAQIFFGANDYLTVRKIYEEIVRRFPKAEHFATLAAVYKELREYDLAVEATQKAVADDPQNFGTEAKVFIQMIENERRR